MKTFRCHNCGGKNLFKEGTGYICECCGSITHSFIFENEDLTEQEKDELTEKYNQAVIERTENYDFERSLNILKELLEKYPDDEELNWAALLAEYNIIYQKNSDDKYVGAFCDPEHTIKITDSFYYSKLKLEQHKNEARNLESIRQNSLKSINEVSNYKVFISYKKTKIKEHNYDPDEYTEEYEWANRLYNKLLESKSFTEKEIFFDDKRLDKENVGWDPHIYAALRKATVLIVLGASNENLNSPWVKSEWVRFNLFKEKYDNSKVIRLVARTTNSTNESEDDKYVSAVKINNLNHILVDGRNSNIIEVDDTTDKNNKVIDGTWLDKVVKACKKACDKKTADERFNEAFAYIDKGDFKKAKEILEEAVEKDSTNPEFYWWLLHCELKAFDDYDLVKGHKNFSKHEYYNSATSNAEANYRNASDEEEKKIYKGLKEKYENVKNDWINHNYKNQYIREHHSKYLDNTKVKRGFKHFFAIVVILGLLSTAIYGLYSYETMLNYTYSNGEATLTSINFFFDYFHRKDLTLDEMNNCKIVKISDAALKNTKVEKVTLGSYLTDIGNSAFESCLNLETIKSYSKSLNIGNSAFKDCNSLNSFTYGLDDGSSTIKKKYGYTQTYKISIGDCAFENCSSLKSLTLNGLTYLGSEAFKGCSNLEEIYIDNSDELEMKTNAFSGTSSNLKVYIPSVNTSLLAQLETQYSNINFISYTRDAVEECMSFIDDISTVTLNSLAKIEKAEKAYNALSSIEKSSVRNYSTLVDARAIYNTMYLINEIGTITLDSEGAIKKAEEKYNSLTSVQKSKVTNYSTLTDARAIYDVMASINKIGTVNLNSKTLIELCEESYEALSEEQKKYVSNYSTLVEARKTYEVLYVETLIDNIGTVSETSESAILIAEAAYNNLSSELKAKVKNYSTLVSARNVYDTIVSINNLKVITTFSLNDISSAENLYSSLTSKEKEQVTNSNLLSNVRTIYNIVLQIDTVKTLSESNLSTLLSVSEAYNALSDADKNRVGNKEQLKDSLSAYNVINLINDLGTISKDSLTSINNCFSEYKKLTSMQQSLVYNYSDLEVCNVECLIYQIGEVTISSETKITTAEDAYNALTSDQKKEVDNYETLNSAKNIYEFLSIIKNISSIDLGNSSSYAFETMTSDNLDTILSDSDIRNQVTSATISSANIIDSDIWINVFPNLKTFRYDFTNSNSTLYEKGYFSLNPSKDITYAFIGQVSKTYNIGISSKTGNQLKLEFENFNFKYKDNCSPLIINNISNSEVTFTGSSSISSSANTTCISAKSLKLIINDNTSINITGGKGTTTLSGGTGIKANELIIQGNDSSNSKITITGGNGINGEDGDDGKNGDVGERYVGADSSEEGRKARAGEDGTDGKDGTDGTAGGDAIIASKLSVYTCNLTLVGGSGGNGGKGGNGGSGGDGGAGNHYGIWSYRWSGHGGNGGNGGSGGNGGKGGSAITLTGNTSGSKLITLNSSTVTFDVGKSGNGGNGGNSGNGGNGPDDNWADNKPGGNGGNSGNSGNGGSCYYSQSQSSISNNISNINSTIKYITANKTPTIGKAGTVGKAGTAGVNTQRTSYKGSAGSKGTAGVDGTMLSR